MELSHTSTTGGCSTVTLGGIFGSVREGYLAVGGSDSPLPPTAKWGITVLISANSLIRDGMILITYLTFEHDMSFKVITGELVSFTITSQAGHTNRPVIERRMGRG